MHSRIAKFESPVSVLSVCACVHATKYAAPRIMVFEPPY